MTSPMARRQRFSLSPIAAALLLTPLGAYADAGQAPGTAVLPTVTVIGGEHRLPSLAGSGQILGARELADARIFSVNEALRKAPGVHAREEEGFGLRPNIGMRGLNPTRSTKVTLLEDGLPLAYAPYGDNASYFHPMVERYERIEILKGASSLLFGPQTIGGIVNYITPAPRQTFGGYVQGTFGNRDYLNGRVSLGGKGFAFDYGHKEGNGARDNQSHELDDLNVKYVVGIGASQALTLRANFHREDSLITYSGLTQAEFERQGARYNPFRNDRFETERTGLSATHELDLGQGSSLLTSAYYAKFDRDWWRQASNSQDSQCGSAFNAARLAGNVVNPDTCNSAQGRLRSYETWGIEPRLTLAHAFGELQAGVRAHVEEQDRKQVNAASATGRTGILAEDNLRETTAYSVYLSNRFTFGNVAVTPIVRHESVKAERTNRLTRAGGDTSIDATSPGIGITWNPAPSLTVFSSLHRGFAPPRVEDLVGNTGTVVDVDAERSTNFEIGFRSRPMEGVNLQAAYFRNDFSNLIAVGSIAGGSTPLSQGKALFAGIEVAGQANLKNGLFGRLAYTWLQTAEQSEAFRNVANGALVGVKGNRQPYAPKHTLTVSAGYDAGAFRGEVEAQYVGAQFSDFANTVRPSADGQRGEIAAYTVWNATLNYRFDKSLTLFVTGKNLADKTYIVDRSRGILTGMPRMLQAGARYAF